MVSFEDIATDLKIARSVLTDVLGKMVDDDLIEQVTYREQNRQTCFLYQLAEKGCGVCSGADRAHAIRGGVNYWREYADTDCEPSGWEKAQNRVKRDDGQSLSLKDVSIWAT